MQIALPKEQAAAIAKPPLRVIGMHGRGDCLHSRAIIRQLMQRHDVWLESSWVSLFHDLIDEGLHVIHKATTLRTQTKNARRELALFEKRLPPFRPKQIRIWYTPEQVRKLGSVLAGMCETTRCDYASADFRLPVKLEWRERAHELLAKWKPDKPLMIYRPPVERPEWGGAARRNPDTEAYAALFRLIREQFFVLSIADLELGKEWRVGPDLPADITYHHGELDSEVMTGLFEQADLVFTTGGFPVILAQSVGTPVITVMGGYEDSRSYSAGARYSKYLGIDPIEPCQCFSHMHRCKKEIDLPQAKAKILAFIDELGL